MDTKKSREQLEKEFDWFMDNQAQLIPHYNGKFVVVKNFKVIGSYKDFPTAINETMKKEELGTFIVQKCSVNPADLVDIISSPGVVI